VPVLKTKPAGWSHTLTVAVIICAASVVAPVPSHAHFILMTPDSWMSQDSLGLPEKLGPCGDEGGGTATGQVTVFHPGQTISITINEVIAHPGHYRVALAVNDRSELPAEPVVTSTAYDPCSSAAIQSPPTFPILADNMLPHTQPFAVHQTFEVTLPADLTCTKCTLQVLEFMSSHGQPCFYHHCADISIQSAHETATAVPLTATATSIPPADPTATPTPTPPVECVGDCNGNGTVGVDDIVTLVNIALGNTANLSTCAHGIPADITMASQVTVARIIEAVNVALGMISCGM
jgi:hypothetical protein